MKYGINFPCPFLNEYTHYTAGVCIILMLLDFEMGVIALHTKELQSFLHLHVHFKYIKKHFLYKPG